MGGICDTICLGKQNERNEEIVKIDMKQHQPKGKDINDKESMTNQNPTFNSKCNTVCHKSSLAQQNIHEDKPDQSNAYPHIPSINPIVYEPPILDPTISIDKDHPFFYRKYGTQIKKPAVRSSFKATFEIEGDNQLSRTFNNNNNKQKGQARYVTKSSI